MSVMYELAIALYSTVFKQDRGILYHDCNQSFRLF